ncbi:MAG: aspartyl protease family protein [Gemmataceae bacterium]
MKIIAQICAWLAALVVQCFPPPPTVPSRGEIWTNIASNLKAVVCEPLDDCDSLTIPLIPLTGHAVAVEMLIQEQKFLFLIDTGAVTSVLNEPTQDQLCLQPTGVEIRSEMFSGVVPGYVASITNMSFATAPERVTINWTVSVLRLNQAQYGTRVIDGILGVDLLTRFGAVIDTRRGVMHLDVRADDKAPPRPFMQSVPIAETRYKHFYHRIPLIPTKNSGFFMLAGAVNGQAMNLVLDTGANTMICDPSACAKLKIDPAGDPAILAQGIAPGQTRTPVTRFQFSIQKSDGEPFFTWSSLGCIIPLPPSVRAINGADSEPIEVLMGFDMLKHVGAIIDLREPAIYIQYSRVLPMANVAPVRAKP